MVHDDTSWVSIPNLEIERLAHPGENTRSVVFTTDLNMPKLVPTLAAWADKFRADRPAENERVIGSVLRTEIPPFGPVLLPLALTGADGGYMVSVRLRRRHFPERRLTDPPVVHLKVLFGTNPKNDGVYWSGDAIVVGQAGAPPDRTNTVPGVVP